MEELTRMLHFGLQPANGEKEREKWETERSTSYLERRKLQALELELSRTVRQ